MRHEQELDRKLQNEKVNYQTKLQRHEEEIHEEIQEKMKMIHEIHEEMQEKMKMASDILRDGERQ